MYFELLLIFGAKPQVFCSFFKGILLTMLYIFIIKYCFLLETGFTLKGSNVFLRVPKKYY